MLAAHAIAKCLPHRAERLPDRLLLHLTFRGGLTAAAVIQQVCL